MKLKGRVAIITGSSKGIGLGIARVYSQEGANVVVVCRTTEAGEKIAQELGAELTEALEVLVMHGTSRYSRCRKGLFFQRSYHHIH